MGLLSRLFSDRRPPPDPIEDPVLGRVAPPRHGGIWWTAAVLHEGRRIELWIGGTAQPHPALLASARDLAQRIDAFVHEVQAFLDAKAQSFSDYPPELAAEVRALKIDSVSLLSPARPLDGMVGFHETESGAVLWRCDLKDGHPIALGGDT